MAVAGARLCSWPPGRGRHSATWQPSPNAPATFSTQGVIHTLATWTPYALLVAGVAALLLTQSAFHAGALRLSLPTLTVVQPLVAVAIGLGFFGERVRSGGVAPVLEVLGLLLVTVGVFLLGRSPLIGAEP